MGNWAYYNEIDPYVAQWMRNLINKGLIAPGVVDERSILDVKPDELSEFKQCHFFAGIGVWSYALRQAGWPDDKPVWTGSCPCQPFSSSGKRKGFTDERHLWPAWFHLIEQCKPNAVFGEQVASQDGLAWFELVQSDMEGAGYTVGATDLCAAGIGAPHIRQRQWIVAIRNMANPYGDRWIRIGETTKIKTRWEAESDVARFVSSRLKGCAIPSIERSAIQNIVRMANPNSEGWQGRVFGRADSEREVEHRRAGCDSSTDLLANTVDEQYKRCVLGCGEDYGKSQAGTASKPAGCGGIISLADGESLGFQGDSSATEQARWAVAQPSGITGGFWRDADWLLCRDGKARPVEPGTFPLAHGATERVGRLRAYGNAINAQAAKAVIEATMDLLKQIGQ